MEDGEINVVGTVARVTFAGPPNYESIADGDKPEMYSTSTTRTATPSNIASEGARLLATDAN